MSHHDGQLRARLILKATVTDFEIEAAFQSLLDWLGRPYSHYVADNSISLANHMLEILLDVRLSYSTDDVIRDLIANLHPLVDAPGCLEVYDFDTGDTESAVMPHFIGATPEDRAHAQVEYGILQAAEWLAPVLGNDAMQQLEHTIRNLPVISPTSSN
ncbi:hypothetical protein CRM94_17255 [Burkholderia gladioli]|uniref:Uncharacterized protein n=1 Tax=Burkholderia gladioli TaxID=28095 RepID=A0A2A7SA65_BURGA|nr:hypothetical protein [Burkholderia gladioli]PEH40461.1 hypothetical protein CRM94_17255 [Burkholderia gladioli]